MTPSTSTATTRWSALAEGAGPSGTTLLRGQAFFAAQAAGFLGALRARAAWPAAALREGREPTV
eukprot:4307984-Pyramimonas_sp.AAC.1